MNDEFFDLQGAHNYPSEQGFEANLSRIIVVGSPSQQQRRALEESYSLYLKARLKKKVLSCFLKEG